MRRNPQELRMPAAGLGGQGVFMMPPRTRFLRRGDRIKLLRLQSYGPTPRPHPGDQGIVQAIDADGNLRVDWDSGADASVNPSAGDRLTLLETV